MARFLVLTAFTSQEARVAHRAAHREYLHAQVGAGTLLMAGPFVDESGGMIVFEAQDRAAIDEIMAADPFSTNDVFATVDIQEVTVVAGS